MKISLTGSSSTGKTTLVRALMDNPEFSKYAFKFLSVDGRRLLKKLGFNHMDSMSREQLMDFQLQYFAMKIQNELCQKEFITDRSFVDVASYWIVRDTFDKSEAEQNILLIPCMAESQEYDITFYLPFGAIPFQADGYRPESFEFNSRIDNEIQLFLDKWKINYCRLDSGNLSDRVSMVLNELAKLN